MKSDDIELVKAYFNAISAHDWPALNGLIKENIIFTMGHTVIKGRENVISGYMEFLGSLEKWDIDILRVLVDGSGVVAIEARGNALDHGSESSRVVPFASFFELEDGKVIRQSDYFDPQHFFADRIGEQGIAADADKPHC